VEAEISYDLVMGDDMDFAEGCYRLPGKTWEVFTATKRKIADAQYRSFQWDSGVSGILLHVPEATRLNKTLVEELLSSALGVAGWREVKGPDSIMIR
jgi:hypothetical protein